MTKTLPKNNQRGFTILELMISTTIFGVIMLIASAGVITIGRNYYKGLTTSRTQEITRSIESDITKTIQVSGKLPQTIVTVPHDATTNVHALCIGNIRYTFVLDKKLGGNESGGLATRHAFWRDTLAQGSACNPVDLKEAGKDSYYVSNSSIDATQKAHEREMLATNMRLMKFNITPIAGLYKLDLKIMYGDRDVIDDLGTSDPGDDICRGAIFGGQFCSHSELNTFVKRRLDR